MTDRPLSPETEKEIERALDGVIDLHGRIPHRLADHVRTGSWPILFHLVRRAEDREREGRVAAVMLMSKTAEDRVAALRAELAQASKDRDVALAAMKREPKHLEECKGDANDPPCVALLAYEEAVRERDALKERVRALEAGVERLASCEAFKVPGVTDAEMRARIDFARALLSTPAAQAEERGRL